jgi:hypothetical protein
MIAAAGALSAGIDAISALLAPLNGKTKTGVSAGTAFNIGAPEKTGLTGPARSGGGLLSTGTFNSLLSAQAQTQAALEPASGGGRSAALNRLFSALDPNGDGQISKSEFVDKLGAGGTNVANAESVFGKIDANGDGAVSIEELTAALSTKKKKESGKAGDTSEQDPLLKALKGASSTQSVAADGSVTTTVTYADGSKVTLTTPPSASASGDAASKYNFVERAIQQQARYLSASASSALSVSA